LQVNNMPDFNEIASSIRGNLTMARSEVGGLPFRSQSAANQLISLAAANKPGEMESYWNGLSAAQRSDINVIIGDNSCNCSLM
ncbi:hypothetical protein PENTCL1PPCAC_29082, partial [Pristionchus entomophagus]